MPAEALPGTHSPHDDPPPPVPPIVTAFDPPANVDDFSLSPQKDVLRTGWDALVSRWMDVGVTNEPNGLFFNPRGFVPTGVVETRDISWDAFPLFLKKWYAGLPDADLRRYRTAEVLRSRPIGYRPGPNNTAGDLISVFNRQQDEYCEWFVERNPQHQITRITFTCEGPEYWEFLAQHDLDLVVQLYQKYVSPAVKREELLWETDVLIPNEQDELVLRWRQGDYNPHNVWNTEKGCMHLTHPANTLQAEVFLAAGATVVRQPSGGAILTATDQLICCAGYGEPNRSSDPLIGAGVNRLARLGLLLTLTNPVGLYLASAALAGLKGKNGETIFTPDTPPTSVWQIDRGQEGRILRARLELPTGTHYTLSDCTLDGKPLEWGGQIVDKIQMVLTGLATANSNPAPAPVYCGFHCCTHPTRTGIKAILTPEDVCNQLPPEFWAGLAPTEAVPPIAGPPPVPLAMAEGRAKDTPVLSIGLPSRRQR